MGQSTEHLGTQFTLYLPYPAHSGSQRVALRLEGPDADNFTALSANSTQPITGGRFYLAVPEGARQVTFTLRNDEDIDQSQTLTLHAQLVDANNVETHVERPEAEIAFTAIDEQPFAYPTFVVVDPQPQNPEIHGTDFDEQILGKSTADVIFPYAGADLVLAGDGDDSVLVHALTGDDTAGDRIELGDGNDFAVRWAGDDTLIGGSGMDVMLAGAGADTLYSEIELTLANAIALGETQGSGGTGDLLDGWAGDDVAIGWNGADGLLGGDGADVLVGMGGDDTAFGDWQFSQYTAASAEWRFERSITWVNPDRRNANVRLVSVLLTEQNVPGGADTIFGGAGADWLFGLAGDDFIDGGRDDDVIFGHEGADALFGRDGADILSGDDLDDGTIDGLVGALHGADTLDGGAGDDELAGNGADDQLYGGDGNDSLGGDDPVTAGEFHGRDYLDGGAGNDRLWGEGADDWLVGGAGDDHLEGDYTDLEERFHGADHLEGGDGADELIGQGGADVLFGGDGEDTIAGDNADGETLAAGFHGDDLLDGGAGNDTLKGGGGKDRLFGGDGQDSLVGDGGEMQGDDELHGGADGDTLQGNGGKDRLYGDAGEDFLDGGAGDDLLQGGADRDRLEGGEGDDTYVLSAGDSPTGAAIESIGDSGGRDTVRIVGTNVRSVRRNGDTPDVVIAFGGDDEVLIEGGFTGSIENFDLGDGPVLGWQQLLGRYVDEPQNTLAVDAGAMLAGSARNDTLTATGGGATLAGGRGDDRLIGSGGSNTYLYNLGDGTDTVQDIGGQSATPNRIVFGAGITPDDVRLSTGSLVINVGWDPRDRIVLAAFDPSDVLSQRAIDLFEFDGGTTLTYEQLISRGFDIDGTGAAETLTGTNVVDRMYGAAGDDRLDAGPGADLLDGGLGNDTLTGGPGDDVYLFGYGDGQDTIADGAVGDSDALALFAGVGGADVELERLANDLVVKLRNALDQVTVRDQFAGDGIDRIDFADGSFWDRIEIAARLPNRLTEGPDTFTGSSYADTIYGGGGDDRLYGQAGDDLVDGGDGADQLYGGDSDDRLLGQAGADWLSGGSGADALEGGAGTDTLQGEDGGDTLSGGAGDDTLRGGAGSDTYRFAPGDGRDTIDDYDASANRLDVLAFWASGSTQVALRREWSIYDSNDDLYFDLLDAGGQPTGEWVKLWRPFFADDAYRMVDRVEFADATVWTTADIRARLTTATSGEDRFRGFGGADALDGGAGNDYIAGGEGNDVILGGDGADSLWGENGDDVLEGGAGDDALSGDFTYPSTWLYQGRDVLRGGAGADSLDGGGGADVLEGGPGADRLLGGEHDDLYLYARGDGSDEIEDRPFYSDGTGGSDTLRFAAGIAPAEVELYRTRNGSSFAPGDDLTLVIHGSNDRIRIASYFATTREIEAIEFADGTRWSRADVEARLRTGAADTLTGTAGDDMFAVDNDRDVVVEQAGGGTDTVESLVSYTLPANVEHLTLTGTLNASATGNDLDNTLRGNANDNRLEGGRGSDTLVGGRGDDVYVDADPYIDGMLVTYTPDTIVEAPGEGYDTIEAKAYDYTLPENVERLVMLLTPAYSFYDTVLRRYVPAPRHATGNALDNLIDASRALSGYPVILDGAAGADAYIGHAGPDTYRLADPGDRILATGDAAPVDAIESAFDFDLAGIGLTLTLIGDAPIIGWGNALANTLDASQNPAVNVLVGRSGDDRYVLGAGDAVIEQPGEGRDTVRIANGPVGEYRLADYAHVEALELGELLYGSALVGGAGDDTLTGNRFANRLDGGAGSDVLLGGDGSDTYVTGRLLGRRSDVARIDEDRVSDDDTQSLYSWTTDTLVLAGLQDDLRPLVRVGNDLVLEQLRRAPGDPANDLLFETVRVVNDFAGARYQVERVRFGDGAELDLARLVAAGVRVPGGPGASGPLWGYHGPDELTADDVATTLQGGSGDDRLRGGAAGDVLAGEGGNDRMLGGAGDDRYTFAAGFGRDYVEDAGGDDTLEFSGLSSTGVIVRASGDRLELAFASGDAVVVRQDLANGIGIERAYFAGDGVWLDAAALAARAAGPVGNLAPFVNAPPRDRAVLEDQPFALALSTDAFVDLDAGDALTYSLTGPSGSTLPAWLGFDAQTLTLSGTPGNADVGTVPLELVATDGAGARASWTMNLVVSNVNDAPVATPPAAQTAFAGQTYVLAVLPDVFSDADPGDWLWIDATLAGGDPLPDWLGFDDGALLGEPTAADLGRYVIELFAFDSAGAMASVAFTLDVLRENHAPTLAAAIPNQTASEDADWAYVVPSGTFSDVDAGDALAHSAALATGGALPAWLAFDPATRRFSGTPQNADVGTVSIRVTATDSAGATAGDTFDLKVDNVNDAPVLLRPSDAASIEEGQPLAYLANAAFTDVDAGDALTYSAKLANGSSLPSWLTINATTGKLAGTPSIGALGTTDVRVTAKDRTGATATLPVLVTVVAAPPQILVGTSSNNTLTGKSGDDRLDGKGGADTMRGGLGDDTYVVDSSGDSVVENANAGSDLVESSITYSVASRPNVEHVVLTGTAAINATGNGGNNLLRGNSANNTLTGSGGVDLLQGLGGNDTLSDSGGNGLLHGGAGTDTMTGNSSRQLFIGGTGNDTISTSTGADVVAFNKGDGQDTVNASSGNDDVVSLGGDFSYSELFLSKSGNNLVLEMGPTDRITLKDWYGSSTNRSVATLQVIAEAMAGYDPASADPLLDHKVETFDFAALVQAFDAARAADANLTRWQMMDELLDAHLAASDAEALGGDLAYQYGLTGSLAGIGFDAAAAVLSSSQFATTPQALQPAASLQQGVHRLA
jgi:Ca2+-binding RTX toxin-like protein